MLTIALLILGVLAGISEGQLVSNCTDLDTNACVLLHKAKPDLCSDHTFSSGSCKKFCGNCRVLTGISEGHHVSNCTDLDTNACVLFHKAKPDLCLDHTFSSGSCKRFCGNCPLQCYVCPTAVRDPHDCNMTISCAAGESCMTKHLMAPDGHHEYIMMCGSADICQGASWGFSSGLIGKRETVNEPGYNSNERHERDITISCCNSDFCNMPVTTTPPVPTTTYLPTPPVTTTNYFPTPPLPATTYATPPGVSLNGCNRDIVFVLDSSGSVGSTNFRRALTFVKDIIHQLHVGPGKALVAMVTFSSGTQIHWLLNKYTSNQALLAAVDNVRYDSGGTHTSDALKTIREHVFTQAGGDRQLAKNVVIVLTDGKSSNTVETIKEAHALHLISSDVITIGVGTGVSKPEIQGIATDNHHVFDLQSYSALHTISSDMMRVICDA